MVTETTEEVVEQVTEPEAAESNPIELAPVEDTPDAPDEDTQEFLRTQGLVGDSAESKTPGTEAGPSPEVLEAATQLREQERKTAQQYAIEQGARNSFQNRGPRIVNQLQAWGLSSEQANAVWNEFNNHHNDSAPTWAKTWTDGLYERAEKLFPGLAKNRDQHEETARSGKGDGLNLVLNDIATAARKGYVSNKEAKEQATKAVLAYKKFQEDKGLTPSSRAPSAGGERSRAGTSMTLQQIDDMPTNQWMAYSSEDRNRMLTEAHSRAK